MASPLTCVERNNSVNKQTWINIGLLGFIILLSIVLLNTEEETNKKITRVTDIDQNEIFQIKVLRKGLDNFEFNKQNDVWALASPLKLNANNARINAMLRILKAESFAQLDKNNVALGNLGLSDPTVIMKLNDHEFIFGDTDAIDQRRYVMVNDKIHLTSDFLYQQLMTNAAFFAEPKLLPKNYQINAIQYPENKIERVADNWQLEKLMDIKPDQLQRIVFNWENAVAISVEKFEPIEASPDAVIQISSLINEPISFVIVSTDPHIVLGRNDLGVQFHLGSDETRKLLLIEGEDINDEAEMPRLELH